MATETASTSMDFLERIGDGFNAFSEWCARMMTKLLGSSTERTIRKMGYIRTRDPNRPYTIVAGSQLAQVNALEEQMKALSEEELKAVTPKFRERLAKGDHAAVARRALVAHALEEPAVVRHQDDPRPGRDETAS